MKKIVKVVGLLAGVITPLQAYVTSQTFFTAEGSDFQKAKPIRNSFFRNDLLEACCNKWGGAFQTVIYGGRTTRGDGSEKIVRFFLPPTCSGCCLNVQEYNEAFEQSLGAGNAGASADYDPAKNVEARHLNIVTNNGVSSDPNDGSFASRVCFEAQQSKIGIGFNYKQVLTRRCDGTTGFWFEASLPVERVRNEIRIRENIENSGGGPLLSEIGLDDSQHVDSVKAAFQQSNWQYGKIDQCRQNEKWGVADMEILVGFNTYTTPCASVNSYLGFVAPTGTRVRSRYVFEPIVGNNKHWGILFGNEVAFNIYSKCCWDINWFLDWNARYLLENHQKRSFDLIGKPWSRYMEVYSSPEEAGQAFFNAQALTGTSGINVFTDCVKVKPRFQGILNQAFQFNRHGCGLSWISEFGYNLYLRQAETVELDCCNPLQNVFLKSVDGNGQVTTARTIKANYRDSRVFFDDPNFSRLQLSKCDINLESAAHPAVISHTIYGTFGLKWEKECPCFAAVGALYQFQPKEINTALDKWLVWTKVGITF